MANTNIDLQKLLQQLAELDASPREINAISRAFAAAEQDAEAFEDAVERAKNRIAQLRTEAENLNTPFETLVKIIQENAKALSKTNDPVKLTTSALNKVASISREMLFDNQGIVDLSERQLQKKLEELEAQREILRQNGESVGYNADEDAGLSGIIAKVKERLELETSINDNLGVAGALIGGAGALMERLGMRSGIFHKAMSDANKEMREIAKNMGNSVNFANKMIIAAKGFSELAKGFGKALLDPTSMLLKIVSVLSKINKASVEFTRLTGQSASSMSAVATEAATAVDLMETAADFTRQTGLNTAAIFTPEQIGQIADAKTLLGLSAEEASKLGLMMKLTGKSVEELETNISKSVDIGISQKAVYQDILSTSDDIVASTGSNEVALAKAASAARKLGLDLTKVNQIADGLLEFESSIEAELEAQLLTGKQINLNKARELALNNDLEGVAEELKKNGASAAEFAQMNRIEQQTLAKALGMSREELGKMVLTEKARASMTDDEIAAVRGVSLERSRQLDIQTRLQNSLFKLAEAFTPILEVITPIVELLGKGAGLIAPYTPALLGAYGAIKLMNSGLLASIKNMNLLNIKTVLFGKMYRGGQFMPGGGRARAGGERAGGLLSSLFGKKRAGAVPPRVGESAGEGIRGITGAISKIDMKSVLQGAAAMAVIAGAVFIFGKAVQQFTEVSWGDIGKAVVGMLALVGAVAAVGAIMMSGVGAVAILAGSAAMLIMASAVLVLGYGVQALATGFNMMMPNLMSLAQMTPQLLGVGMALMSIAAGLGMIAVAGIAAIPALSALSMFALMATPLIALGGLFGDGGGEEDGGMAEISAKLDTLISVVSAGGDVYLDSDKVGRTQAKGFSKLVG